MVLTHNYPNSSYSEINQYGKYFLLFLSVGVNRKSKYIVHLGHISPLNSQIEGTVSKPLQIDCTDISTYLSAQEIAMTNSSSSLLRQPVNI